MSFDSLLPLIDFSGLKRLETTTVMVVGLGGVGSYSVTALARTGVGGLILIDPDTIEKTNINRQLMAFHSTVGQSKTAWLKAHVKDINPAIRVTAFTERYTAKTHATLFQTRPDFIIDAIDDMPAKIHLIHAALDLNIPFISVGAQGNRLGSGHISAKPLAKTSHDPIAKKLRKVFKLHPAYATIPLITNDAKQDIDQGSGGCVAASIFSPSIAGLKAAEFCIKKVLE